MNVIDTMLADIAHKIGMPKDKLRFKLDDLGDDYSGKSEKGVFTISRAATYGTVAEFLMVPFPGCCGIVISTSSLVHERYRELGIGTVLNEMRKYIASEWGYSLLVCTDVEDNIPQQKILTKNGWNKLLTFKNNRTKNNVCMHSINIPPRDKETPKDDRLFNDW